MDKGSIGALIMIVAIIDGIIAVMAYRQVMETIRREGKEFTVIEQFSYFFRYRKIINAGYLQDEESKSAFRLYIKTSLFFCLILLLGLINLMTDSFIISQ
jgi:hypothetical protein